MGEKREASDLANQSGTKSASDVLLLYTRNIHLTNA